MGLLSRKACNSLRLATSDQEGGLQFAEMLGRIQHPRQP